MLLHLGINCLIQVNSNVSPIMILTIKTVSLSLSGQFHRTLDLMDMKYSLVKDWYI